MSRLLAKYFWVINLLFILIASWLAAQLVIIIIQDRLTNLPPPLIPLSASSFLTEEVEPYQKYSLVVERNIFNPNEKGLKLLPWGEIERGSRRQEMEEKLPAEALSNYKLLGTVIGPEKNSFAILFDALHKKQNIYRLYENIGEGKIINIQRDQIVIKKKERVEILNLAAKGDKESPPPMTPSLSPQTEDVVRRLSANRFVVSREDVLASVGNINQFMTQARFRPHFTMGRPSGYIISEIVPGSLFEKIGLRNNDIIKKVNGQMINQPEEVYQAYAQLLRDAHIEVEIERGGRMEVFRYEIR